MRKIRGQLTIFLAICLIIIITAIAFVVNVGLLVKAKINLQNAVDAAAWSGAASQSKLLTSIAYLNWELRNVYKEWMFKTYVLSQLSFSKVDDHLNKPDAPPVDFRRHLFEAGNVDKYNVPSVCVHFHEANDICELYDIPGIPDFPPTNMPGVAEQHQAILDAIVSAKSNDCSSRSMLNFLTATNWIYGTTKDANMASAKNLPLALFGNIGSWPASMELALRIRNLEMLVNRPPLINGVCRYDGDCQGVDSLSQFLPDTPINERPIKAFWSAYRNLSNDLKQHFKLTEVPPTPKTFQSTELSGFLINENPGELGWNPLEKHYLDLRLMMINYAIFYSAIASTTDKYTPEGNPVVATSGACISTKIAIPVPGYILGVMKNPAMITYYSVIGETKFSGLFYPFSDNTGITIKAHATAKPFGGRIGPHLFDIQETNPSSLVADDGQFRSYPYIFGIQNQSDDSEYAGVLIPASQSFWVNSSSDVVGGVPKAGEMAKFGHPNMVYSYLADKSRLNGGVTSGNSAIPLTLEESNPQTSNNFGLFDGYQFYLMQKNLGDYQKGDGNEKIYRAVFRSRAPTRYDAINYLIPTILEDNEQTENIGVVTNTRPVIDDDLKVYEYEIYAPLIGPGTLYPEQGRINRIVDDYLNRIGDSIDTYLISLHDISEKMRQNSRDNNPNNPEAYYKAADLYYPNTPSHNDDALKNDCANDTTPPSIAAQYYNLFKGTADACNVTPLSVAVPEYIYTKLNERQKKYYKTTYTLPDPADNIKSTDLMSAYMPGTRQGASDDGTVTHPFLRESRPYLARRNFYSTKFVHTLKFTNSDPESVYGKGGGYKEEFAMEDSMIQIVSPNRLDRTYFTDFTELF